MQFLRNNHFMYKILEMKVKNECNLLYNFFSTKKKLNKSLEKDIFVCRPTQLLKSGIR